VIRRGKKTDSGIEKRESSRLKGLRVRGSARKKRTLMGNMSQVVERDPEGKLAERLRKKGDELCG